MNYYEKIRNTISEIIHEAFYKKIVGNSNTISEPISKWKFVSSMMLDLIAVGVNLFGSYFAAIYRESESNSLREKTFFTRNQILQAPFIFSGMLFGLFVLLKFVSKELIGSIINIYIMINGCVTLASILSIPMRELWPVYLYPNRSFNLTLTEGEEKQFSFLFSYSDIAGLILSAVTVVSYQFSRSWILNNIISSALCVSFLEIAVLDRFAYGIILFIFLFIYDVFWVFGSNVMMDVAQKIDAPLMFKFPSNIFVDGFSSKAMSALGLGDVVIPGLYLTFLLRFDLSKKNVDYHYFRVGMIMYATSLMSASLAVFYTGMGQPALFYIVPLSLLGTFATAIAKGEIKEIFKFKVPDSQAISAP